MRAVRASFENQLAVVAELLREVGRMEEGEKRHAARPSPDAYERDLLLAGLAQRIAQAYTIISLSGRTMSFDGSGRCVSGC